MVNGVQSSIASLELRYASYIPLIGWGATTIKKKRFPGIPRSTIQYTLTQESKRQKQESLSRSGAPRKLTEDDRDHIYETIQQNPSILIKDLLSEVDDKVKRTSIWRLTHEMGLRKWRKMQRPTLTPQHAQKRLAWARRYEHFTSEDWARVYWSDECTVERGIGQRQEWTFTRPKDQLWEHPEEGRQVQMIPTRGKQIKQMFWSAFSALPRRSGLIPLFGDPQARRGGVSSRTIEELYLVFRTTPENPNPTPPQPRWDGVWGTPLGLHTLQTS